MGLDQSGVLTVGSLVPKKGRQSDAPPPYFTGARLNKTCVARLGTRKMGESGPPP